MLSLRAYPKARAIRISDRYKHFVTHEQLEEHSICAVCGRSITGNIYFCPVCGNYYCVNCTDHTVGGNTCPECSDLVFLRAVRIMAG